MAVWFRANKLAVNINKTKYMIFTMRGKKIDADLPCGGSGFIRNMPIG